MSHPERPTSRRIALLGWAQLSLQERQGTGYNLYASELASGLAERGHSVFYLRAGLDYALGRGIGIRRVEVWRGIECHHLVNSPNLAPAAMNFGNMASERHAPELVGSVLAWLEEVRADVVHVHSLEGFSLDLIPAVAASGRPVVVTPHNYWYVCPQVDLLHGERELCEDYEGGRRCAGCIPAPDPASARRRRAIRQALDRTLGMGFVPAARAQLDSVQAKLRGALAGRAPADSARRPADLFRGFEPTAEGTFDHELPLEPGEAPPVLGSADYDQNERFLGAKHHRVEHHPYGERRSAGIAALNASFAVLAPSAFLLRVHAAMGVEASRLRELPYGSPRFDGLHRRAASSPFYSMRPWEPATARRPLRLAFHGTTRNNKGLLWLLRSIPLLEPGVRRRCQFVIRAAGWDWPLRKMMSPYPEVQFGGGYDGLQLLATGGDYEVGIMTHIWFDNLPLVMLEHLHAGKFVVSSRLGGPADWIEPPTNGLLYAAGHPDELAAHLTSLVSGTVAVPSPREIHAASPLPSFLEHVRAVESVYEEALGARPA